MDTFQPVPVGGTAPTPPPGQVRTERMRVTGFKLLVGVDLPGGMFGPKWLVSLYAGAGYRWKTYDYHQQYQNLSWAEPDVGSYETVTLHLGGKIGFGW